MLDRLLKLRAGGQVRRYHTTPLIGGQTNAEHTFHMLVLLDALYPGEAPRHLVRIILYHDVPEGYVGDTPYRAKRRFTYLRDELEGAERRVAAELGIPDPELLGIDPVHMIWFRMLDSLECVFFALDQLRLGNRNLEEIFWNNLRFSEGQWDAIWANDKLHAVPARRDHPLFHALRTEAARLGSSDPEPNT